MYSFDLQNHQQYLCMSLFSGANWKKKKKRPPLSPMMMGATTCFPNNDALLIHDIDMGWPQNNY